jgi:hypothetical protein
MAEAVRLATAGLIPAEPALEAEPQPQSELSFARDRATQIITRFQELEHKPFHFLDARMLRKDMFGGQVISDSELIGMLPEQVAPEEITSNVLAVAIEIVERAKHEH